MTDAAAAAAARAWGEPAAPPRLVHRRENAVYRVALADGRQGALRLHRPGYQSPAAIAAELGWTEGLAAAGFPCPRPMRTALGALLGPDAAGHATSMVAWIDAAPVGPVPDRTAADLLALMDRVGALLAHLHTATEALALPPQPRHAWTADSVLGDTPLWGPFWENQTLSRPERARLLAARTALRARLDARTAPPALIHADVLQENLLDGGGRLWLIDFDDAGYGDPLYDLGTALVQHWQHPAFDAAADRLAAAYARHRPGADTAGLPLFVLLRALASAGWVIGRLPDGHPGHRAHAERALALSGTVLG